MSKGLGFVENSILYYLPRIARAATLTVEGQEPRQIQAAAATDICSAMFGKFSRSQQVSTTRALKALARSGQVGLLYINSPGPRGNRIILVAELIPSTLNLNRSLCG
jgi:hypothetical protein